MKRLIVVAIIGFITGGLIAYMVAMIVKPEVKTYPIVDKYEHDGKCYLAIEIEISPEEYIGYDIGDEYRDN